MARRYPVIKQLRFTASEAEWLRGECERTGWSEAEVLRAAMLEYRRSLLLSVQVGGGG